MLYTLFRDFARADVTDLSSSDKVKPEKKSKPGKTQVKTVSITLKKITCCHLQTSLNSQTDHKIVHLRF